MLSQSVPLLSFLQSKELRRLGEQEVEVLQVWLKRALDGPSFPRPAETSQRGHGLRS